MNTNKTDKVGIAIVLLPFILAAVLLVAAGCNRAEGINIEEGEYAEFLILGKTEKVYLGEIKELLQRIYSETEEGNKGKLEEVCSKYMEKECVEYMLMDKEGVEISDGQATVEDIKLAYGRHQEDKKTRVLVQMNIETDKSMADITLEMRLNDGDMIHEIVVW